MHHHGVRAIGMNTPMATESAEERLRRLESGYERAPNNADLFQMENRMMSHMGQLESRLTTSMAQLESRLMRWVGYLMVGIAVVALAEIGIFVQMLLG